MKKFLLLCCSCLWSLLTFAQQELEWKVSTFGFADNREYASANLYSQSILGIRFAPEIGLRIDSTHRIRAGINFLQEFGAKPFGERLLPILYYNYQKQGLSFYIGTFPRYELLSDYPRAILTDTLMYYRPNIEGLSLKYQHKQFKEQIWVDWTSRETQTDREQFMVGLSGRVGFGLFYFTHYLTMLHTANSLGQKYPLRDNFGGMLQVGVDLSERTALDSLTIGTGILASIDRLRGVYDRSPKGAIVDIHAAKKSFFLHNTFYKGDAHDIAFGDRFYTKDTYDRLDLGWKPFRWNNLEAYFMFSLHFVPGAMSNQQVIQLRYSLGDSYALKKK